jgi:hypothetical protein
MPSVADAFVAALRQRLAPVSNDAATLARIRAAILKGLEERAAAPAPQAHSKDDRRLV